MSTNDLTPIVIGVGEASERIDTPEYKAMSPVELASAAAREALKDAGADVAAHIDLIAAVRQLCYHTLRLRDAGAPHTAEAAMCKWLGPKTAVDVIHQCLLTHGHYGWSLDLPHQQRLRDVMGLEIGDGTAQIMKMIVARERAGKIAVQHAR